MSYINSLKNLRKEILKKAGVEAPEPVAPTRGLMGGSQRAQPIQQTTLKYDPKDFILKAMEGIQQSRIRFDEKMAKSVAKSQETSAKVKSSVAEVVNQVTDQPVREEIESVKDRDMSAPSDFIEGGDRGLKIDSSKFEREGVDVDAMAQAIKDIESSGGDYQARGPIVKSGMYKGERAMGAYQIMPGNLPQWSKAALGEVITEEEFLAKPALQDAIFLHQMTKSIDKHGTVEDAAAVWFTGQPLASMGNRSDGQTTAPEYLTKFRKYYNANRV